MLIYIQQCIPEYIYTSLQVCCTIHSRANEKLVAEGRKSVKSEGNRILVDSLETFTNTGNDTPSSRSRAFTANCAKVLESGLLNPHIHRSSEEQFLFVLAAHFHARPPALMKKGAAEAAVIASVAQAFPLLRGPGAD